MSVREWKNHHVSHKHSRRGSDNDLISGGNYADDKADAATIINFSSSFTKGAFEKLRDSQVFVDPVTGIRKIEYRC